MEYEYNGKEYSFIQGATLAMSKDFYKTKGPHTESEFNKWAEVQNDEGNLCDAGYEDCYLWPKELVG